MRRTAPEKSEDCGCEDADLEYISRWWIALSFQPEERAFLRACDTPEEAAASPLAADLTVRLRRDDPLGVAALAALLAQVEEDDHETRFICKLGLPASRPAFSEFHFRRLKNCRTLGELYVRLKRALVLLGRKAHVESFAECFIEWLDAHHSESEESSEHRQRIYSKWEREYLG